MPQQTQQQPTQTRKATIFLHPGAELTGPLQLTLPAPVVRLLRTLDLLQRRQDGEDVIPTADDSPSLAALERLSPGEIEASIAGGVAQVMECGYARREEVLRLSSEEVWAVHKVRRLRSRETEQVPPDQRQREVAAELERLLYGSKASA